MTFYAKNRAKSADNILTQAPLITFPKGRIFMSHFIYSFSAMRLPAS